MSPIASGLHYIDMKAQHPSRISPKETSSIVAPHWAGSKLDRARVTGIEHVMWDSDDGTHHKLMIFTELSPDRLRKRQLMWPGPGHWVVLAQWIVMSRAYIQARKLPLRRCLTAGDERHSGGQGPPSPQAGVADPHARAVTGCLAANASPVLPSRRARRPRRSGTASGLPAEPGLPDRPGSAPGLPAGGRRVSRWHRR